MSTIAPELFQVLEPLLIITRISGFFPVSWEKVASKYLLKWSLSYSIYSYVLAIFLMVVSMMGLWADLVSHDSIRMRNSVIKYVALVDLGEIVVTVFMGMVTIPFRLEHFWKLMGCFNQIDAMVPSKLIVEERRRLVISMGSCLSMVVGVIVYDLYLWVWISSEFGVFFRRFATIYVMYLMIFIQQMPFCCFARLIGKRIEEWNLELNLGLDDFLKSETKWVSAIKVASQKSVVFSYCRLNNFIKLVEDIDEAIEAANDFCGVNTLLVLSSCLLHLVVTPYFLLVELCNNGYSPFIFLQVAWIVLHLGRLMVIVETCQTCADEYQKSLSLVLKLLTCPMLPALKEQVEILTVQLSNKKVKFSSFGMMNINRSLLTAFGGSVTTFLVILFQYGGTEGNVYYSKNKT